MAQFTQVVLDYLEAYEPELLETLKRTRQLPVHVEGLVGRLYAEHERVLGRLKARDPDASEEQLTLEAEEAAIAAILPVTRSQEPEAGTAGQ